MKTIHRKMWTGNDVDSGDHEFVLETTLDGEGMLFPIHHELHKEAASPEALNAMFVVGGSLGNALTGVPKDEFAYRLEGHTLLWEDTIDFEPPVTTEG